MVYICIISTTPTQHTPIFSSSGVRSFLRASAAALNRGDGMEEMLQPAAGMVEQAL